MSTPLPTPFLPTEIAASRVELQRERRRDFVRALRFRALEGGNWSAAIRRAEKVSPQLALITRAGVTALSTTDAAVLAEFNRAGAAWLETLAQASAFDAMLGSMRPAAFNMPFAVSTAAFTAEETEETGVVPVSELTLVARNPLPVRKATAMTVITRELSRLTEAEALIDAEMRSAIAAATDFSFLRALVDASAPIASTNSAADIDALLASVSIGSASRPYFVFAPDEAKKLATQRTSGVRLWPEMGVQGGSIAGLPALVSDQLPDNTAILVDAAAIAANGGTIEVDVSEQASVQMDSAPADSPTATEVMVSLWQHNLVSIRGTRFFGFRLLRDNAVASLSGIAY